MTFVGPAVKILSLLPAATEIVAALGAAEQLVGVSHECDFPPCIRSLPVATSSRLSLTHSAQIHRDVTQMVQEALAIYEVDAAVVARLRPDVIITQDLCDVCGVTLADLKRALKSITMRDVEVISLSPHSLDQVFADFVRVGQVIGRGAAGLDLVARSRSALERLRLSQNTMSTTGGARPSVLSIEWIDPPMPGGLWTPELILAAGGEPLLVSPGEKSVILSQQQLGGIDPDVVVIKPCGFSLSASHADLHAIRALCAGHFTTARSRQQIFVADGNAFFNRSGPCLIDSAYILADILRVSYDSKSCDVGTEKTANTFVRLEDLHWPEQ